MSLKDHTTTPAEVARQWNRACDKLEAELHAAERRLAKAEAEIERRGRLISRLRSSLGRVAATAERMRKAE